MNVVFRSPEVLDIPFILSSWLKSYRKANNDIKTSIFYKHQPDLIIEIIQNSSVVVACNPEDINQIYGYLIFKKNDKNTVLHYTYVKRTFRQFGIFKKMLKNIQPSNLIYATHKTECLKFLSHYQFLYNPYER